MALSFINSCSFLSFVTRLFNKMIVTLLHRPVEQNHPPKSNPVTWNTALGRLEVWRVFILLWIGICTCTLKVLKSWTPLEGISRNADNVILTGMSPVGFYFANERMRLKWLFFVRWPQACVRTRLHFLFIVILTYPLELFHSLQRISHGMLLIYCVHVWHRIPML